MVTNPVKPTNTSIESRLDYIRSAGRGTNEAGEVATAEGLSPAPRPRVIGGKETMTAGPSVESPGEGGGGTFSTPEHRPRTIAELGIRRSIVEDLALKTLYLGGTMSARELARQMRLSVNVADELLNRMRTAQQCQVTGMTANLPTVALTDQGRKRGLELLSQSQYAGATPVSLESYVSQVRKQSTRNMVVRKPDVERAFGELIIDSKLLGQIGTGLNSGATIFVHGPEIGRASCRERV